MEFLLQHLLINSAKKSPDKKAVVYEDKSISYLELDKITNNLATVLIQHGIKKGDRVGIYLNKSISSIISIYGILKTGAVYVPLDPKAPVSRLEYIIKNCGIECLLTSTQKISTVKQMFPENNPLRFIVLNDESSLDIETLGFKTIHWKNVKEMKEVQIDENPTIETSLAYILYTSGSTGVPKGVMISHLNAFTFLKWVQATFNISPKDRLSNHAPLHFDLSILDIFGAAQAGATLILVPEFISAFPMKLADWIEENQISIWYSVPSTLTIILLHGELKRHRFENLRLILFAGEVFPTKYLRNLMKQIPHPEYYNLYGPTETNVITFYKVENISPDLNDPIPIGKACTNMEVFALNENGELINKPGEEGELFARGSCVAQGYWGDMEKTFRNFVLNPLQPNFQEKVYHTGDIVSLDSDGSYLFKGRRDHMIKSRGYRIEIGEIETVLYSHPDIKEAAVVAIPDELIGNRIKSYIVCHQDKKISATDIRLYCGEKLTKYMIPEEIEFCQSLPKTSTGKIDKPALLKKLMS